MKLDRVKALACSHIKSTAHWLSSKKIKELKQLYKASPEDAIREFGTPIIFFSKILFTLNKKKMQVVLLFLTISRPFARRKSNAASPRPRS